MKYTIYLDLCCFNRPYDDQTFQRIYLETEAKLFVQEQIKEGTHTLYGHIFLILKTAQILMRKLKNRLVAGKTFHLVT